MRQDDFEAFCLGLDNGRRGRLIFEGLPRHNYDEITRAMCVAGFEIIRIGRGIGSFPVPVLHFRDKTYRMVGNDATRANNYRPVFNTDGATDAGYYDLRALVKLKGART